MDVGICCLFLTLWLIWYAVFDVWPMIYTCISLMDVVNFLLIIMILLLEVIMEKIL